VLRDSAAAVVWLLSDEARFVTGTQFVVNGGERMKERARATACRRLDWRELYTRAAVAGG
jgi:NAD(P)-dependent dehydrogenase (short-subunit alcohol dehydrogenase family)